MSEYGEMQKEIGRWLLKDVSRQDTHEEAYDKNAGEHKIIERLEDAPVPRLSQENKQDLILKKPGTSPGRSH
jgi:hypothetical protein